MAKSKQSENGHGFRSTRLEALAARVRKRAEAAVSALHAASKDRQAIHELEWRQADHDTLGDMDEIGDALQGLAAWVMSGLHPDPTGALKRLSKIQAERVSLRARLIEHSRRRRRLWEYFGRQEELREALKDYFREQIRTGTPDEAVTRRAQKLRKSA